MSTGKSIGIVKLPRRARSGIDVLPWATEVNQCLQQLRDRAVTFKKSKAVLQPTIKPPLWVTLQRVAGDPVTYEVYAEFGHVVPRHNASGDTGEPIEITSLPTPDAPLAVIEDDKLWVELTIDVEGKCTAAEFDSGTTWPEDAPPELIGGDDQSGTEGQRYIRIAEIIANPESTATTPPLIRKQLYTGHIDHFQPTLSENTTTSPSGGDARVMKTWNASAGRWDFRYLEGEDGVEIEEEADRIVIRATGGGHPWKVTCTEDDAEISAGFFLYVLSKNDVAGNDEHGYDYVEVPIEFAGSTITALTGTQYIYAKCELSTYSTSGYAYQTTVGGDGVETRIYLPIGTITVYASANAPTAEGANNATGTGYWIKPIAKVIVTAGVAAVDKQYLTHNPSMHLNLAFSGS